jgi:hypothetical protein
MRPGNHEDDAPGVSSTPCDHYIATALLTWGISVDAGSKVEHDLAARRGGPNQTVTKKEESQGVPCLHGRAGGADDLIPF